VQAANSVFIDHQGLSRASSPVEIPRGLTLFFAALELLALLPDFGDAVSLERWREAPTGFPDLFDRRYGELGTIVGSLVRAAGLEPAQPFRAYGFSYPLRLSPPDPARLRPRWVWGLDYPFTLAAGWNQPP
jgi:hypothetical protein